MLLLWSCFLWLASAQVQIYNLTVADTNLSSTCVGVLNQNVNCDASIQWVGYNGRYESAATLSTLCTTGCSSALSTWLRRVAGACTTRYNDTQSGNLILPALWAEAVIEHHNLVCQQNKSVDRNM